MVGVFGAANLGCRAGKPRVASRLAIWFFIGACTAGHAVAHESHAGFSVRVRLSGSGHAANIRQSRATPAGVSGAPSPVNQLRFGITTRAGYLVRFEIDDPAVEEVTIHRMGREIRIASHSKDVFVPSDRGAQTISYSVKVRPGAEITAPAPVRATLVP